MHRTETQMNMMKAKAYMRGEDYDTMSNNDYLAGPTIKGSMQLSSSSKQYPQPQYAIKQKRG